MRKTLVATQRSLTDTLINFLDYFDQKSNNQRQKVFKSNQTTNIIFNTILALIIFELRAAETFFKSGLEFETPVLGESFVFVMTLN